MTDAPYLTPELKAILIARSWPVDEQSMRDLAVEFMGRAFKAEALNAELLKGGRTEPGCVTREQVQALDLLLAAYSGKRTAVRQHCAQKRQNGQQAQLSQDLKPSQPQP